MAEDFDDACEEFERNYEACRKAAKNKNQKCIGEFL